MFSVVLVKFSKIFYGCVVLLTAVKFSHSQGICPYRLVENLRTHSGPTTAEVVHRLIANCRYDKLQPPPTIDNGPLPVYVKVYFYFLKSYEAHNLQFTVYMLLQCRFVDTRLQFDPQVYNVTEIVGTRELSRLLWMPHVYFNNERQSSVMGPGANEVMTHIYHDGTVLYTKRVQTTLFCWMKLQKFPFDTQYCTLVLDSWSYNTSHMTLQWEADYPVHCRDQLTLTEFTLVRDPIASETVDDFNFDKGTSGDFQGNYSSLVVTFHLQRESGFYIYDYFIPSILLVVVSWVSFWLEADEAMVSGRVVLGCSTMLTFITLAHQTGNSLPKVSYIKASDIWFLVCTGFIFGSLVEFAFVNTIYRSRRKQIGLKKLNTKYVLKETLTPKSKRKELNFERSSSCPDVSSPVQWRGRGEGQYLGVELNRMSHQRSLPNVNSLEDESASKKSGKKEMTPTIMTPKEVSNWIDQRSRIFFPVSFLVFNIGYWTYVYWSSPLLPYEESITCTMINLSYPFYNIFVLVSYAPLTSLKKCLKE